MIRLGLRAAVRALFASLVLCGLALASGAAQPGDEFGLMSSVSGQARAYTLDARRGLLHRYNFGDRFTLRFYWSPDGQQMALTLCRLPRLCALWLYTHQGSAVRMIKVDAAVLGWSPDGTRLLVVDLVGNSLPYSLVLTDDGKEPLGVQGMSVTFPIWSPASDVVAFVGYRRGSAPNVMGQIYRVQTDGIAERLTFHPGNDNDPQWSPDGTQIAFISSEQLAPAPDLYLMGSDGTNVRRVTRLGRVYYPVWSPDGAQIAFINVQPTRPELYVIDVTDPDARPVRLADHVKPIAPVWSGERLYYAGVDNRLYAFDLTSGTTAVMTFAPVFGPSDSGRAFNLRPAVP